MSIKLTRLVRNKLAKIIDSHRYYTSSAQFKYFGDPHNLNLKYKRRAKTSKHVQITRYKSILHSPKNPKMIYNLLESASRKRTKNSLKIYRASTKIMTFVGQDDYPGAV